MYEDIIDLPRHRSVKHRRMTPDERAVQFAPFAALRGYREMIDEVSRENEVKREISEEMKAEIGERLRDLEGASARISYFVSDGAGVGGTYKTAEGKIRKIDRNTHTVIMESGSKIAFDDIDQVYGSDSIWGNNE